jgi:glycogen synthase
MKKILHVALEYSAKVGGLGAVTTGLLSAMNEQGEYGVSIVTPHFDCYDKFYADAGKEIEEVATLQHLFNGELYLSTVSRVCSESYNDNKVYHYLIKPTSGSTFKNMFEIGDQRKIYLPAGDVQPHKRREYFNGAVASMVRVRNAKLPAFDILHAHTWHVSLALCLAAEWENLKFPAGSNLADAEQLNPLPHKFFTIHMLLWREHGAINGEGAVNAMKKSVGLPDDFEQTFSHAKGHLKKDHFKQHVLGLVYSDYVNIVSKSVIREIFNGRAHNLPDVFQKLDLNRRFVGIANGINYNDWDPTSANNLKDYVFDLGNISAGKQKLKEQLAVKYPGLDPKKKWVFFVGRFAQEKGIHMLPSAAEAVKAKDACFIVMGVQVTADKNNPVSMIIESFKDRQAEGIVVIEDPVEQRFNGKLFRCASDFTLTPSDNETGGIVPMEAQACTSIPIVSDIQGLPETVLRLTDNFETGTGFRFNYYDENNRNANIKATIVQALELHDQWLATGKLNGLLARLTIGAKKFDWRQNPVTEYAQAYATVLSMPRLTCDQIRTVPVKPAAQLLPMFDSLKLTAAPKVPLVFQIGFNKCGTWSLQNFFWMNGYKGVHYGYGRLALDIAQDLNCIATKYSEYCCFFDMEYIYSDPPIYVPQSYFRELDTRYPGSKFILNTRNKIDWLRSRCTHGDIGNGLSYVQTLCEKYKLTREQLIDGWSAEWDAHHKAVKEYFKDRPKDLVVFDFDKDKVQASIAELCDFLKDTHKLDPSKFQHINKTDPADLAKTKLTM